MITKSFTFTNNTTIDPDEVNQNFDDLIEEIKGAHHRDADGTAILPADIGSGWGLIPSKGIIAFNDEIANVPAGFFLCDGANGTPNLVGKFIQGAGTGYALGATGGSATHTISIAQMPSHNHGGATGGQSATHTHTLGVQAGDQDGSGSNGWISGSSTTSPASNDHTHSIPSQGSGSAFNIRPPFNTLPFIMKS